MEERTKKAFRISFIGDIMCEKPLLNAARISGNRFDFERVFRRMEPVFAESMCVIGNLETVFAGPEQGYTDALYSFNTPDAFVEAMAGAGISLVSTATNHCLDRGVDGLVRTIEMLNQHGVSHIGTYNTSEERDTPFTMEVNGVQVVFLNYTYGTNPHENRVVLRPHEKHHVNLLRGQHHDYKLLQEKRSGWKGRIFVVLFHLLGVERWIRWKRRLGLPYNRAYQDNREETLEDTYLTKVKEDVWKARRQGDLVVMCLHSGGQFNREPGTFTRAVMNVLSEAGVDLVIGTHPHVVQKAMQKGSMRGFYSLGNFSLSPSSVYVLPEHLPEYGIMAHCDVKKSSDGKVNMKLSFSVLKMVEDSTGYLEVWPAHALWAETKGEEERSKLEQEIFEVVKTVMGRPGPAQVLEEYLLDKIM